MTEELEVGQVWRYKALEGFEDSRLVIGAINKLEDGQILICVSVLHAPVPRQNKQFIRATIPFLAFSLEAFELTVTALETHLDPETSRHLQENSQDFSAAYSTWKTEPEGPQFIEVPFPVLLAELCKEI